MKKSFFVVFFIFFILATFSTWGSAFDNPSTDFKYIASQQLSVSDQIEKYRKIYDKAYEEFKATEPDQGAFTFFYNHHIDGLMSMLRMGYNSVKSQAQLIPNPENQKRVIANLDNMHENASFYNVQKKMSQALFLEFNKYFAWLSDYIKSLLTKKNIHSKNGEGLEQLKKNIQRVLNYQAQTEDLPLSEKENYLSFYNLPFFISNFLEIEEDLPPVFWPVMILYTHDPIPVDTFVDQRLGYDYPTDIAQFDITLVPREKPTKKDPHFSFFMTTYEMLDHDAFHIGRSLADSLRVPLFERSDGFLKKIYHLSKDMAHNERKIVRSALFLITHELVSILLHDDPNLNETHDWHVIIDILKRDFKGGALRHPLRDINYKGDLRDLEFALKGVTDLNNEPFLPPHFTGEFRPAQDIRQQIVADGFERFWETFRDLLVYHNLLEPRTMDTPFETDALTFDESLLDTQEPPSQSNTLTFDASLLDTQENSSQSNTLTFDASLLDTQENSSQIENNIIVPEIVKSSDP